jgi:hypothetical protein
LVGRVDDLTLAVLEASATALSASTPVAELGNVAVNSAGCVSARHRRSGALADVSTVLGM